MTKLPPIKKRKKHNPDDTNGKKPKRQGERRPRAKNKK